MTQDLYNQVVEFVNSSFKGKNIKHFERTVYWIEKFYSDCTEAHRIAAYSHDIERAIKGERDRDYLNQDILKRHQEDGAEIMGDFLKKIGADEDMIEKVKHLVSKHEEGGDMEQNALMDADSASYFETNAEMFVKDRVKEDGYEKVKSKIDWMFNRMSSGQAKKAAEENYKKWSAILDQSKNAHTSPRKMA
jgi:hypothetical protein